MTDLIEKLYTTANLTDSELQMLIDSNENSDLLEKYADEVRQKHYGKKVFLRGLIEISNYCKNDCYYCGIRRSNRNAERYRLSREEILSCCENGYNLGFRTFVMQGGEDSYFSDEFMCPLISEIKEKYPDCAVTLSLGERSYDSYKKMKKAGADRYLLRHETASEELYKKLHPSEMSLANRKECLFNLRELGYQVGAGFMVGVPFQKTEHLIEDLRFLQELQPGFFNRNIFLACKNSRLKLNFKVIKRFSLSLCKTHSQVSGIAKRIIKLRIFRVHFFCSIF